MLFSGNQGKVTPVWKFRFFRYPDRPGTYSVLTECLRYDLGLLGGWQHYRDAVLETFQLELLSSSVNGDGSISFSFALPDRLPELVMLPAGKSIRSGFCTGRVMSVTLDQTGDPDRTPNLAFEIDWKLKPADERQVMAHRAAAGEVSAAPDIAEPDYLSITASTVTGGTP